MFSIAKKKVLWEDDGTGDLSALATSAQIIHLSLDEDSPGSGGTASGGTDVYVPAQISTIDVANYDFFGLASTTVPTAGEFSTSADASAFWFTCNPVMLLDPAETDTDFLVPYENTTDGVDDPNTFLHINTHVQDAAGTGGIKILSGSAAATWSDWGWGTSGGGGTLSTDDRVHNFAWFGQTLLSGFGGMPFPPNVSMFDRLRICAGWKPQWSGTVVTQPRIKGKIWGVWGRFPRGF